MRREARKMTRFWERVLKKKNYSVPCFNIGTTEFEVTFQSQTRQIYNYILLVTLNWQLLELLTIICVNIIQWCCLYCYCI
jgi:hypothetical protein